MKDEATATFDGIVFQMDHNPNDILMAQAQETWDSISEEQHMRDHEIMMRNIEQLARGNLERESSSEDRKI